jgi:hypothetical protein
MMALFLAKVECHALMEGTTKFWDQTYQTRVNYCVHNNVNSIKMAKNLVFCVLCYNFVQKEMSKEIDITHPLVKKPHFVTCPKWLKVSFASDQTGCKQHF